MESYNETMRRIVITGPESSGKTTLALDLALRLDGAYVPEVAREFLEELGRPYEEHDLLAIARAQLEREELVSRTEIGTELLICDTDLITIRIWSEEKYGHCDPWIEQHTRERAYDLWLLCSPDMPWEPDPLRENPHDRDRLFGVYEDMLKWLERPYLIMQGDRGRRLAEASKAVADLLRQRSF